MPEIPLTEAKDKLSRYVGEVEHGRDITITRHDRPVAALVSIERYGQLDRPRLGESAETAMPKQVFTAMLHGMACYDADRIADELTTDPTSPTTYVRGHHVGVVFDWLLDHENPWWAQDYVLTLLHTLRALQDEHDMARATLDQVLMGLALSMPAALPEARHRIFDEFRDRLVETIRYLHPRPVADEILTPVRPEREIHGEVS